ncbi:MAG: thioredoxin [Dehalococcoidia bacterium]|nr:thioredoxin [Dehalococcoidia bacterium]
MAKPLEVNEKSFEQQVLKSASLVLVDFWAPWCGPCRMVAPIVEELAEEYEGQVDFTKVNTDENSSIAVRYGIQSIPTLMVFKDGQPVDQIVGFKPKGELKKHLDRALALSPNTP